MHSACLSPDPTHGEPCLIAVYDAVLEARPDDFETWQALADAYGTLGQFEEATVAAWIAKHQLRITRDARTPSWGCTIFSRELTRVGLPSNAYQEDLSLGWWPLPELFGNLVTYLHTHQLGPFAPARQFADALKIAP